jgi:uncharacterized membrane protein YkoI
MKYLITIILGMFLITSLEAQVINVPKKSQSHFGKKYPSAKEVTWINNVTDYQVKFKDENGTQRAYYHMDGTWNFTELYIDNSKIPAEVNSSLSKSRFSDWTIESSAFIENNKGKTMYRLEVKKGLEKKFVFYDKNGKEIKTSATT